MQSYILLLGVLAVVTLAIIYKPYTGVVSIILIQVPMATSAAGLGVWEVAFSYIFFVTILAWVINRLLRSKSGVKTNGISLAIILTLVSVTINLIYSIGIGNNIQDAIKNASPFILVAISFVVYHELNTEERIRWVTRCLLAASTLTILWCMSIAIKNGVFLVNPLDIQASPFRSPLYLVVIPIAIAQLKLSRGILVQGIMLIIVILHAWRSLVGFRRQPIFLFLAMAFFVPYFVGKIRSPGSTTFFSTRRVVGLGGIGVVFSLMFVLSETSIQNLISRFDPSYIMLGIKQRLAIDLIALDYFMESPILGKGFGFKGDFAGEISYAGFSAKTTTDAAVHNLYIFILMYSGILGFASIVYLLFKAIRDSLNIHINIPRLRQTQIWVGGGVGVVMVIIMLGVLSVRSYSLEVWATFAIVLGIMQRARRFRIGVS